MLQASLSETETNYKQLNAALERDNIELRRSNQLMAVEITTKQKEIEDLIIIVTTMENGTKMV